MKLITLANPIDFIVSNVVEHWCPIRVKESFDLNTAMLMQCSIQTERVLQCKTYATGRIYSEGLL